MRFVPAWRPILESPTSEKVILLTVVLTRDGIDATGRKHLATMQGALRYSTSRNAHVLDGSTMYPFWGYIAQWPNISFVMSPEEGRVETPETQVRLLSISNFPHTDIRPGGPVSAVARLDLWSPGISLSDVIPLMQGPVTSATYERTTGGITLSIRDEDERGDVLFPPGSLTIEADDFPDAPAIVLGRARRQMIFGAFPDPLPAIQIDQEGKRFYLMEPFVHVPPNQFFVNGLPATENPTVVAMPFHTDPSRRYTELVFRDAVDTNRLVGDVAAGGGVGVPTSSPILTLLEDVGRYRISAQARTLFEAVGGRFDFSVFTNNRASVLGIVKDRLLPQTPLVMAFRNGQVQAYELMGATTTGALALGEGLRARIYGTDTQTDPRNIYNVIEVRYQRNYYFDESSVTTRNALVVDANYGGSIGSLLAASERLYGRRELSLEAADLVRYGPTHPAGVTEIAELVARLRAFQHRRFTYDTQWLAGMRLDLNVRRTLTDTDEGLASEPVRVVEWALLPTGPRVTLQTEDADSR